jgi:hypothetical protein
MRRLRLLAWLPGLTLAAALLAPAAADATQTQTFQISGGGTEPGLLNPCTGGTGTLSYAYQGVLHTTELDRGTFQVNLSSTSTWTLLPDDPSQPSYTGRRVSTGEATYLNVTLGWTFNDTFNIILHGSDGSLLKWHGLLHVAATPDGTVTSYIDVDEAVCL